MFHPNVIKTLRKINFCHSDVELDLPMQERVLSLLYYIYGMSDYQIWFAFFVQIELCIEGEQHTSFTLFILQ